MSFYNDLKIQEVIADLNTLWYKFMKLPRWLSGKKKKKKKICLLSRRGRFDSWVGKFPGEENGNPLQ